jgi:hypothetical protein
MTNQAAYIESLRAKLAEATATLSREEQVAKLIPEAFEFSKIHTFDSLGAFGVIQFNVTSRADLLDIVKRFPPVESYDVKNGCRSLPVPFTHMTDAVRDRSTYSDIFGVVLTVSKLDSYASTVVAKWYVMLGGRIVRFDAKLTDDTLALRVKRGGRWGKGKFERVDIEHAPDSDGLVVWAGTDLSAERSIFWRSFESFARAMESTNN